MANLTKAEREKREAEKHAKLTEEIEAKLRVEYEERLRAELEKKNVAINDEFKMPVKTTTQKSRFIKIPLDIVVPVTCNTVGGATYISKKANGYIVEWEDIGATEYMELGELVSMRNTDRRFFEDNWIVLNDSDEYTAMQIYDFLKVAKYYQNIISPENLDEFFSYSKEKIIKTISTLSRGMKETIAVRAKQKLDDNTLDKNIVDILESSLGIQFTI